MQIGKTSSNNAKGYRRAIYAGIFLVAIDQLVKYLINRFLPSFSSKNTGIIFGFLENNFWIVTFLALGFLILLFLIKGWRGINKTSQLGLLLIVSGAISNVIDRIAYGGAVDYIHLRFWSSFNLADCYIVIGIILYGWQLLKAS